MKRYTGPKPKSYISDTHKADSKLPKGCRVENGFLMKNNTIISLSSSSLLESAAQGFLLVDEVESYNVRT